LHILKNENRILGTVENKIFMSHHLTAAELYQWCNIPSDQLIDNPALKVPFRMVKDSIEMGNLMASNQDFSEVIRRLLRD
jgi:hypothetical protein